MFSRSLISAIFLAATSTTFAVTFTEDFEDPNWMTAAEWTYTASPGSAFDTQGGPTQFTAGDASTLGADAGGNGSNYGGVSINNPTGVTETWDAYAHAVLDYTVQVQPNTSYFFEIDFESMMYDDNSTSNPSDGRWRNGMQFHIGNSAQMELGTVRDYANGGGFTGPWSGDGGTSAEKRVGTQFHAIWGKSWDDTSQFDQTDPYLEHQVPQIGNFDWRGIWHNAGGSGLPTTFTTRGDRDGLNLHNPNPWTAPGDYDNQGVSTIITTGADGLVTFRTGLRLKGQNVNQVSFVMDNLSLTLTQVPEPTSLALLAAGGLMLIRRRRKA